MINALKQHWPEYLMEAAALGIFMISACLFGILLEHPDSPVRRLIADPFLRRFLAGLAMGLTAITIIYSPWGKQSGAHMNPSVTLTFFRLGKISGWDAVFYVLFQFIGGVTGVLLVAGALGRLIANPAVSYVVTVPGGRGGNDLIRSLYGNTCRFEPSAPFAFHGACRRRPGRDLHHPRSADFRDEHESGAHFWLGRARAGVDRPLDLFHSAAAGDAAGGRVASLAQRPAQRDVRKTAPSEYQALHLQVRVRG